MRSSSSRKAHHARPAAERRARNGTGPPADAVALALHRDPMYRATAPTPAGCTEVKVVIPRDMHRRLSQLATRIGCTKQDLVCAALARYFRRLKEAK